MGVAAALPPPGILVLALATWIGCLSLRPFRHLAEDRPGRLASLDGLRGILALCVFGHHVAVTTQWQATGAWRPLPSPIWTLMGQGAVIVFFMITGFLFFGRMRHTRRLELKRFLAGRLVRIYPVYLFAIAVVAICALSAGPDEPASSSTFFDLARWLVFDPGRLFGFSGAWVVMAGVPWSLRYEWLFYLALPMFFVLWRAASWSPWLLALLCTAAAMLTLKPVAFPSAQVNSVFLAPFAFGGMVSLIARDAPVASLARGPAGTALVLASLVLIGLTQATAFGLPSYLLLCAAFAPVALGNSLSGLLTCRAARVLGAISYDIYLLHGIVLYGLFHLAWPQALAADPAPAFVQMLLAGTLVIGFALLVHRTIEAPCMAANWQLSGPDPRERLAAP